MRLGILLVVLLSLGFPAFARDDGDVAESILLPFAFRPGVEIHGAFGTIWRGEVWMHNRWSQGVNIQRWFGCSVPCLTAVYPGNFVGVLTEPFDSVPDRGIVLTPDKADLSVLSFSNRIYEVTRHAQPQGIEVPVVREEQFLDDTTTLLGIPGGAAARSALRVYDPRRIEGPDPIKVEALDGDGNVLGSLVILPAVEAYAQTLTDNIRPGFAMIADLASAFPAVANLDHFHLRLTPLVPRKEYWAMVSVTDNDTQQVLLITPQ